ncbi:MAG: hypothetical protein K0S55_1883 [Clostridia bacterium]|nr:hypothetical protein [Clostridia bacterium]
MYPILETERLVLRPWKMEDAVSMFRICSNINLTAPVDWPLSKNIQEAEHFLKEIIKCDMYWAIVFKPENKIVGAYGFNHSALRTPKKREKTLIWLLIEEEYRNKGIATEATQKIMHFAFLGAMTKFVFANHLVKNQAAGKVLEKSGFTKYNVYPKSKPNDDNSLVQFKFSREDFIKNNGIDDNTKTVFYTYEVPESVKSPYSFANPIRKIEFINYIKQPTGYLCGQSVIAMLAGVTVDEVIAVMQNDKGTSIPMMSDALEYYGLETATKTRLKYKEGTELPKCCILSMQLPGYGHWSLYYKGKFYDPEFGVSDKLPEQAKLGSYWEVIC